MWSRGGFLEREAAASGWSFLLPPPDVGTEAARRHFARRRLLALRVGNEGRCRRFALATEAAGWCFALGIGGCLMAVAAAEAGAGITAFPSRPATSDNASYVVFGLCISRVSARFWILDASCSAWRGDSLSG